MKDYIDRQAAIDAIEKYDFKSPEYMNCFVTRLKDAIKADLVDDVNAIPSVEVEPVKHGRWIPVSERLPEEDTEVLILYRYKEGEGDTSHVDIDITTYGQMYFGGNKVGNNKHWRAPFEYFHSNYEVIAWMPLPKPYAEEGEDA